MGNGIARRKLLAGFVLAVVVCLEGKSVKGSEQGHKISIWSYGQKYNKTSGLLYARIDSSLELNCSSSNNNSGGLEWKVSKGISVGSSLRLENNSVIQYKINKVSWSLNRSMLWCGTRGLDNGVNVTLIVGDLPSPPRDLTWRIYDVMKYKVFLSWKHALYTGGLPAYYNVSYSPCHNSTCISHADKYQFCRTPHDSRDKYSCFMPRDDMMILLPSEKLRELFHVTIVTVNEIGVSDAVSKILNLGYGGEKPFMPTPLPPLDLKAEAEKSGHITVRWKARNYNMLYNPNYIILYHAEGDTSNRTKEIEKQTMVNLGDDIRPYTKYYIYLMVEVESGNRSQASTAIGPVTTTTEPGVPQPGPKIKKVKSRVYNNDINHRDVVLHWEEPEMTSWRGKPSNITVFYRNSKSKIKNEVILPVARNTRNTKVPTNVTLTGLNSSDIYKVSTKLCNTRFCGGTGDEVFVKSVEVSSAPRNQRSIQGIIVFAVIAFVASFVIGLLFFIKRQLHRSRTTPQQSLKDIIPEDQLCPCSNTYDYADDTSPPNKYSDVQPQQC